MSLSSLLIAEMQNHVGTTPTVISVADPSVAEIAIDFSAIDSMSCSFSELRLNIPALQNADIDDVKEWGEALSQRITYLLENIGPLEIDPTANQVLIRSTPPGQSVGVTRFYEMILKAHSGGNFSLRRYESEKGMPGRSAVDIQTTHEVLVKLVDDLIETIP